MSMLIRLWPLFILVAILVLWRLWHLRVRGEGDPDSTAIERKRWKIALIVLIALLVGSLLVTMLETRPHQGAYHPLQWYADGTMNRATIGQEAE